MNETRTRTVAALRRCAGLLGMMLVALAAPGVAGDKQPPGLAFRVAKVVALDDNDTVINDAVVLVRDGKLERVGSAGEVEIPKSYRVYEFPERWLAPGLVEGHNHTAGGLFDLNDGVYLTNPGLNTRATIQPQNDGAKEARTGGVTTAMLIPGSGTNISGMGTVVKMGGKTPDEAIIRSPGSLKIAQAGNPERWFIRSQRRFMNWNTRQTLQKALDYHEAWQAFESGSSKTKPAFNPIFDAWRGVFRHEVPVTLHTQIYQVVMTSIDMIANKFKLWTVLDHCTFDGWKTAPLVLDTDAWAINGPRQLFFDRSAARIIGNADGWWKNGVHKLGINTDAPVVPEKQLSLQAAMACWLGWLPYPALRGVTAVPAKALGLYDRVGSIEKGKDADFGIWTGDPLDPRSSCLMTVIDGNVVYDATKGQRRF